MRWWEWARSLAALVMWVRTLIGPSRPYTIEFRPGKGSYVQSEAKLLVVDPTMVEQMGGAELLPFRWRRWTIRTIEQLQWHASRALARHEAAHILFTESWPIRGMTHGRLMNSLEDGRIERLLGKMYPWCWYDFLPLGQIAARSVARSISPLSTGARRILPICLLHRWDVLRPKGHPSLITFANDEDRTLWEEQIRPLVEESWRAPTCARVGEIAAEILKILGVRESDSSLAGAIIIVIGSDDGFLPSGGGRSEGDEALVLVLGDEGESEGEAAGDGEDVTAIIVGDPSSDSGIDSDPVPPGADEGIDDTLWPQPYKTIEAEVIGDARRLARDLTPPSPNIDVRPSDAYGTFNVRQHVRTQGETPLLKQRDDAPDPSGLAVVLLVDRTSSMGNYPGMETPDGPRNRIMFFDPDHRMVHARKASMMIERACALAQPPVPLAIGFAGNNIQLRHRLDRPDPRRFQRSPIAWIKHFNTPPQAETPRALLAGMYGDSDNEAVSRSLELAAKDLASRPERSRLIIYIHDGSPTDESPGEVKMTVDRLRSQGYHIVGLFVGSQYEYGKLAAIFGAEHTLGVEDLRKMPDRLAQLVKRYWRSA